MRPIKFLVLSAFLLGLTLGDGSGVQKASSTELEDAPPQDGQNGLCVLVILVWFYFLREDMNKPGVPQLISMVETVEAERLTAVPHTVLSQWSGSTRAEICQDQSSSSAQRSTYFSRTNSAIHRALKYISDNMSWYPRSDPTLALAILQKLDSKQGNGFEKQFGLSKMISDICSTDTNSWSSSFCLNAVQAIQSVPQTAKHTDRISLLRSEWMTKGNLSIGTEREELTGALNQKCQLALVLRCEIPRECEVFFRQQPGTMYMLTHQLLQRMFGHGRNCGTTRGLTDDTVNDKLCTKMYMEAELIARLGYPELLRDVFGEYIGLCGFLGYTNFYRADWLEAILSWQGKEVGCFPSTEEYQRKFLTSENAPVILSANPPAEEKLCRTHLTSVQVMAVAGYWDYLQSCQ